MTEREFKGLFYCYSKTLKTELAKRGFKYETRAQRMDNYRSFWLYVRTDELNKALDEINAR